MKLTVLRTKMSSSSLPPDTLKENALSSIWTHEINVNGFAGSAPPAALQRSLVSSAAGPKLNEV